MVLYLCKLHNNMLLSLERFMVTGKILLDKLKKEFLISSQGCRGYGDSHGWVGLWDRYEDCDEYPWACWDSMEILP